LTTSTGTLSLRSVVVAATTTTASSTTTETILLFDRAEAHQLCTFALCEFVAVTACQIAGSSSDDVLAALDVCDVLGIVFLMGADFTLLEETGILSFLLVEIVI